MAKVIMPRLGVSVTEGTLSTWLKQVGDEVAIGEPICEVSTDKVDTEIESTVAGVLTEQRYAEGDTVPVGEPLAVVGGADETPAPAPEPEQAPAPELEAPPQPVKKPRSLVDEDDAPSTADGMALDMPEEPPTPSVQEAAVKPPETAEPDRTPLAELLARGTGSVVVLKGHRTVITDGNKVAINTTGNPAMATPGSGDALTGIIASLIGLMLGTINVRMAAMRLRGEKYPWVK